MVDLKNQILSEGNSILYSKYILWMLDCVYIYIYIPFSHIKLPFIYK